MPPKKIPRLERGQKTLFSMIASNDSHRDDNKEVREGEPAAKEHDTKKIRMFNNKWLSLFSWLKYDSEKNFMFCDICTKNGKENGMTKNAQCKNFQKSTLDLHVAHPDHALLIRAPVLRETMRMYQEKQLSKYDKAALAVIKTVHWITQENIPLIKFKSLLNFVQDLHVEDTGILKSGHLNYDSPTTANEILESMSLALEDDLRERFSRSPFITALADESTDISNHKRLVVCAQIIMKPATYFVSNVECMDTSGSGIAAAILQQFEKRGVGPAKIMSLGSDGASVMTGKTDGAAAIIRRQNPHCVNVHCVAHKLALCTSQAAANIPALKTHQQVLTDLFYYFKGSSKREGRRHNIQKVLDDPVLTFKELHSVRWLSYYEALNNVYRSLDGLLTYLSDIVPSADPKAAGLRKKIGCEKFISICHMMMDAMEPVTVLSQFFQTENVDVALVKVKLDLCLSDLKKVKLMQTSYLKELEEHLRPGFYKDHQLGKDPQFSLKKVTREFVDNLELNIKARFPDDFLTAFGILSMRPISFLSTEQLDEYDNTELERFCQHYAQAQTVQWKVDGGTQTKSTPPLINEAATKFEWALLKRVVLAEQYPRDSSKGLWSLINRFHGNEFPNLIILAQLSLTLAVHTAGCERGFSVQNQTLTPSRNRLCVERQDMIMRVRLGPNRSEFNFEAALAIWKEGKERRLYKLKALK